MPEFDDFVDLLSAAIVIIIISILITLAWMSTYVRDQPIVATAVVVFQQETLHSSSMENIGQTSDSSTSPISECETPSNISPESESVQSSSSTTGEKEDKNPLQNSQIENRIPTVNDETNREHSELEKCENAKQLCSTNSIPLDQTEENITTQNTPAPDEMKENCVSDSGLRNRKYAKSEGSESQKENVMESQVNSDFDTQNGNIAHESIRIKLKFLDDTQRLVRGQLTEEVGNFKRANFDPELSSNRVVRLIFNGQLLNRDNSTLGQYGLFDNCVVHCHISQPLPSTANERGENASGENDGLDLSEFLSPLLLVIVAFLWYLRYEYSYIFNTSATIVLVCLTALLLISQYALIISFNISLGFEGGNGNSSSSSSSNSSARSTSSTVDTESPPQIEQNPDVLSSQTPNTEISEEERGSNNTYDSNISSSSSSQMESRVVSDLDSRTESLGSSFSHSNHRPPALSTTSPILGR